MDVREATADDFEVIRTVAAASMHESYDSFLEPTRIDDALREWYGADTLAAQLEGPDAFVLVVVDDDEVVAFVQADLVETDPVEGRLLWIHVHPDARGNGLGSRLLVRGKEELLDRGADRISGLVLEANDLGIEFYDAHGFTRAGAHEVEVGDEAHTEVVYVQGTTEASEWGGLDEYQMDGQTVHVSYSEADRGSAGPFYTAYNDPDRETKAGYFCGACQSLDVSMNAMGLVECNDCGNRRKASRWDAGYL